MANEAVLKVETHIPINYTCSTAVTIEKGAIVQGVEDMYAQTCITDNAVVAGITQSEKLAAETSQNSVAVYRGGIFNVTISASSNALVAGDPVVTAGARGANYVVRAEANQENVLGYMLEGGTDGQTKLMELRPTTMQLA